MPQLHCNRDGVAGLLFCFLGLFFVFFSQDLPMGSAARMASGTFPCLLGALLSLLGLLITAKAALKPEARREALYVFDLKRLTILTLAVTAFALLLPFLGLVLSLTALTLISVLATREPTWKEALSLAFVINVIVWLVFIGGIDLQIALWPDLSGIAF